MHLDILTKGKSWLVTHAVIRNKLVGSFQLFVYSFFLIKCIHYNLNDYSFNFFLLISFKPIYSTMNWSKPSQNVSLSQGDVANITVSKKKVFTDFHFTNLLEILDHPSTFGRFISAYYDLRLILQDSHIITFTVTFRVTWLLNTQTWTLSSLNSILYNSL